MQLRNPFSDSVRLLFVDVWECWECGENGTRTGGLELHHIKGRESSSALNGGLLCKRCHSHVGHSFEEEKIFLIKTIKFLLRIGYTFTEEDLEFYKKNIKYYE